LDAEAAATTGVVGGVKVAVSELLSMMSMMMACSKSTVEVLVVVVAVTVWQL